MALEEEAIVFILAEETLLKSLICSSEAEAEGEAIAMGCPDLPLQQAVEEGREDLVGGSKPHHQECHLDLNTSSINKLL